jgi:hypothetical protein
MASSALVAAGSTFVGRLIFVVPRFSLDQSRGKTQQVLGSGLLASLIVVFLMLYTFFAALFTFDNYSAIFHKFERFV